MVCIGKTKCTSEKVLLRINFTSIFKVFTKLPESRSDSGNLENFENTSEINPLLHESTCDYLFITCRAKFCTKDNFQGLAVA